MILVTPNHIQEFMCYNKTTHIKIYMKFTNKKKLT